MKTIVKDMIITHKSRRDDSQERGSRYEEERETHLVKQIFEAEATEEEEEEEEEEELESKDECKTTEEDKCGLHILSKYKPTKKEILNDKARANIISILEKKNGKKKYTWVY